MDKHLKDMRVILKEGENKYAPRLLELLSVRCDECQTLLDKLQSGMGRMSPELIPVHENLISILRSTSAACTRPEVCVIVIQAKCSVLIAAVPC